MLIPRIPFSWYAIAALSLALGACGWGLKRSIAANGSYRAEISALNGSLKQASEQRALDIATLDRLALKNAATARESARAAASLRGALAAKPEWAAQPVPKEVQDALRQP